MVRIPESPLSTSCAALPWRDGTGRLRVTAIVKATFALRADGLATLAAPLPLFEDAPRDPVRPSSLATASDFVPFKRHADLLVTGHVHPCRPGVTRQVVDVAVARGAEIAVHKRFVAVGPREPVGLGPIAPSWPGRAAHLPAGVSADELLQLRPVSLPSDLDVRFFQSAPPDQWMAYLRGGEQVRIAGLHPDLAVVRCRLPALHAFARIFGPGARDKAVALMGDTLWIDMDALVACVTFRGHIEVAADAVPDDVAADSPWTVKAGLAPCEDIEETLASPRGWAIPAPAQHASAPFGGPSRSPTVDPVSVENFSGFAVGKVTWSPEPSKARCTVIVKATLDLPATGGVATIAGEQVRLRGDEHSSDQEDASLSYPSDHAPLKPRADVFLRGTAHAAPGKGNALVSLSVGSLEVRVAALAPRRWGKDGAPVMASPFEPVPLTYEHALGGPGFSENPAGTGIQEGTAPPRLEDPDRWMRTRADRPPPAALGPVSPAWRARRELAGTFDREWQHRRWPCFPADLDPAYFQAAPARLQTAHLRGDESFRILGTRPEGASIEGRLPGIRPRAFVLQGTKEPFEVPLALDTLLFDTDALKAFLVFRGSFERTDERQAARVVVFREDPERPRSREDMLDELCLRDAQPDFRHAARRPLGEPPASYSLRDAFPAPAGKTKTGLGAVSLGLSVFAAARRRPQSPPAPPPPAREEIEARLRSGQDLSKLDLSGADLRGLDLSKRDLRGALLQGARLEGARLQGANLTGAHLAGIDASDSVWDGADLTRADLTRARLSRASLIGATLKQATLSRADLETARLDAAEADGALFAFASLKAARADGARLSKTDFTEARLDEASFRRATLDDAKLYQAVAQRAVFYEATLEDARFEKAVLTGASLRSIRGKGSVWECADLGRAVFGAADLTGAVFAGALLVQADLRGVLARTAVFRQADLSEARLDGADLMRVTFEGACLRRAVLRGASLYQAETWMAVLDEADLTGAIVTGTKLATA